MWADVFNPLARNEHVVRARAAARTVDDRRACINRLIHISPFEWTGAEILLTAGKYRFTT